MTALKPADGYARGVASVRYPLGTVCAHPYCDSTDVTAHHIFPRSQIGNSSWFVLFGPEHHTHEVTDKGVAHVIPLCGHGTTGHHGDVESHDSWIKYEDGVFVWYDRWTDDIGSTGDAVRAEKIDGAWVKVGPVDPQPGAPAKKKKRRTTAKTPEERKARVTTSIKTPKDEENVIPELVEAARDLIAEDQGWREDVPTYFVVTFALAFLLQNYSSVDG
jgi:hypothetical protein